MYGVSRRHGREQLYIENSINSLQNKMYCFGAVVLGKYNTKEKSKRELQVITIPKKTMWKMCKVYKYLNVTKNNIDII